MADSVKSRTPPDPQGSSIARVAEERVYRKAVGRASEERPARVGLRSGGALPAIVGERARGGSGTP